MDRNDLQRGPWQKLRGALVITALCILGVIGLSLYVVAHPPPRPAWVRRLMADLQGANRSALKPLTGQQNIGVILNIVFLGQGAAAPINAGAEGDPGNLWVIALTRQAVGKYTLRTVDPWPGFVNIDGSLMVATIATSWSVTFGLPVQNADNTWTVTIQTFAGGALTDVILNDLLGLQITLRNSILLP